MNNHLRKISSKDTREVSDIMVISPIDAEIVSEIIIALKKLKQKDLSDVLDQYKKKRDEDIRDLLLSWNTEHQDIENEDEEKEEEPFIWFRFEGKRFRTSSLFLIETDEILSESDSLIYQIIINRTEDTDIMISNIYFNFFSEEERDKKLVELEQRLEQCNIKFI